MANGITKEFWKNIHFENMTAGFLQRCQNSLRRITPEMMHFHAWKKIDFHKYCLLIVIFLTKCTLYYIWRILQPFLRTMTYKKGNICFHELIFYRQIRLISCRSGFWHLRRKTAGIFSKWIFSPNSFWMSWAISSGKMQVKK